MNQTLKPKPGPDDSRPAVLVVLDVDGVLNRFGQDMPQRPGRIQVADGEGNLYWIDADPRVLRALDKQAHRPDVAHAWLTTWSPAMANLVTEAFGGLLAGGYVIAGRPPGQFVPADWKLRALREHMEQFGEQRPAIMWADDDAVAWAMTDAAFSLRQGVWAGPMLLFDCVPELGLTVEDVAAIEEFVDRHTS